MSKRKHVWGISKRYNALSYLETCSVCKEQRRVEVLGPHRRRYTYVKTGFQKTVTV